MDIFKLIEFTKSKNASDLHLAAGNVPLIRIDGELTRVENINPLTQDDIEKVFTQIVSMKGLEKFQNSHELDFKYIMPDGTSLRCNAAQERGQLSLSIRLLPPNVPTLDELQLPEICKKLARLERGLIIVAGPTGSGKTTTQAAMINYINTTQTRHILSFEDPIEYFHTSIKSKVTQRELGDDTFSFAEGLKHALRHDPDVIVVGEVRDSETAAAMISMAETGHLVIATSHAPYAAQAVERIIDLFPYAERFSVQMRLASLLNAVLCQTLVPRASGAGRIAAVEIMMVNSAIRNLIRESKLTMLSGALSDYGDSGNVSLDEALFNLYWDGIITQDMAFKYCHSQEEINNLIRHQLTNNYTAVKKIT
jgi:twitching motility protein PilT